MSRLIPDTEIDRVKRETDLVALIQSRGIELARHGTKDLIGRCPFHQDNATPNLIVTPEKGLFHCMACGKAGNAIQFVSLHDGLSFRHAFELLATGGASAFVARPFTKQSTVPLLPSPLNPEADDAILMGQVVAYYHERLKQGPNARAYLASRGLDNEELINTFQLGTADRTLGLRLPYANRKEGEAIRNRLAKLGLWRESGHEHLNGCIVVPFHDQAGNVASLYGRRITRGDLRHIYQPGPHRGIFNRKALKNEEIILCEAVLDAMTFWVAGFRNVTSLYGTEGFTDELWQAILAHKVQRVKIAYDNDDAGNRATQRDTERFQAHGIEVFRVQFPHGMDANEYAQKVQPASQSLAVLVNGAIWLGGPKPQPTKPPEPPTPETMIMDETTGDPMPVVTRESIETGVGWTSATPGPQVAQAPSSLLVAVSSLNGEATKKETGVNGHAIGSLNGTVPIQASKTATLEQRGDAWFLDLEAREYRVMGLEKTIGTDTLKVALRLRHGERFHLDQIDLNRDQERRRFIERATEETGLTQELLKRDMGRLLLATEQAQAELAKPQESATPTVLLTPEEREEALAWLTAPDLIPRLREAFQKSGLTGEENNTLVAYLACVSRKLERPLAVIIQSASAAGKTTLMDHVLSFFPQEERVKYSAMTGQSLYYLGETNLKHKILAIVEEAGAEKASYALKLLQSEGELTIASTGKDPTTGKMITQEYHLEGPTMIFLTTTAIDLDEELQNRCLTLAVDETSEQTERIHQVQRERRTLAGLIARTERKDLLKRLQNAQRLLQPLEILNPYAPALTFASGRTRNRRDHEKYLTLIDAIALMHQHQRASKTLPNGQPYLEITLDDIALANQLAPEVLGRSLDELPPQTRRLLGHIRDLVKSRRNDGKDGHAPAPKAGGTAIFSRKELRDACGWSLTQVRVHLERLVELEYITIRHGRLGSQFSYELQGDVDAPESMALVGLISVDELRAKYHYTPNLTEKQAGVAGVNGHMAEGGKSTPPPVNATPAVA